MDKNAIYKYAVWARNELIARVTQKAEQYEITAEKSTSKEADSIGGKLLTEAEKNQRKALIEKIQADGFEHVMEEVAYTWFNRFTALRFMEVNNYLPSHTRVFTNESGEFKPQILADAIQLDLEGLNMDKVFELKDANKTEELYKYLLITQCNALSGILPRMFQKIEHYTELLLPDYLLREGSVIEQMIALIPEEDWTDQVQIIGWLYQYYNSEPKDAVFAALKKNVKISKANIPAATQIFTPDWIVRYMVENSLGRLWLEGHPNDTLKSEWKYYLGEAEQEPEVKKQLEEIREEYVALKPEEIRCIDPCMGSGHILCYIFDVLVRIYEDYGYTAREAAENIVEKNLWGLDIDERAAQLAYFAVMMKARQYDRRFFTRGIQPHVYAIDESNGITSAPMHDMGIELSQDEYGKAVKEAMRLVEEMHDAKEYGSIINVTPADWKLLRRFAVPRGTSEGQLMLDIHGEIAASERLQNLINVGEALSQKYHVVITNPPYMGANNMEAKLSGFIKDNYPNSKSDISTVFMEKTLSLGMHNSFIGMINIPVWMFLSSFEELRRSLILSKQFINLLHLGRGVFGADFGTTSFVLRNSNTKGYISSFRKLYERQGSVDDNEKKIKMFFSGYGQYFRQQDKFMDVPGYCIAYGASNELLAAFTNGYRVDSFAEPKQGLATADNNRFLRLWFEVDRNNIAFSCGSHDEAKVNGKKWFPYNKGGGYRKWYGNNEYVINWEHDGQELCAFKKSVIRSPQYYFRECLSWCKVTISGFSMRYMPKGFLFDVAGCSLFLPEERLKYVLGFANSKVNATILAIISPTVNYEVGHVASLPILDSVDYKERINALVEENIRIEKEEWDSFEVSWDFVAHPLIQDVSLISDAYAEWEKTCNNRFSTVKKNEEELNQFFVEIYGMTGELSCDVEEKDICIRQADIQRDIRGFISYAVGCMFGRYSLDVPGTVYAGGKWDESRYQRFVPDKDGIIPICDDEYFDDDIVARFVTFVKTVYGEENLEDNLRFISDGLGGKGIPREVIRNYFINEFYADHLKMYQKRPIYWMFDSGKKNGFKCLVYMHRYQSDTIARIRTDYVHEQQSRYRTAIEDLTQRVDGVSASEKIKLNKQLQTLQAQAVEIREYEEKIHHLADQMISINLDDGVKDNYELFKDVLAKLK